MSTGGARRGRRDNGLDASEYAVAGDVDPRVGEHLLDVLAAGGIAAYLQPSADLNPVTRTTTVPARPVDRLYVDRVHLATARDYLSQLADEGGAPPPRGDGGDPDVDAEWEKIIAGYHLDAGAARPWPDAEDVSAGEERPANEAAVGTPSPGEPAGRRPQGDGTEPPPVPATSATDPPKPTVPPPPGGRRLTSATHVSGISVDDGRTVDGPSLLDGLDTFGADLPDGPEDGYTPPPPPPLPRPSGYTVVGVLAIVLGFALFLFPTALPVDPTIAQVLGFGGIMAGFVTLVWRLRPGDDDPDPDDGAVV
ncbi:DUF308 domain-containing protein [Plantactinospora sp. GCM10030261]|uniref:DUF308 domain-containing protein n=1 Tax=Plantactinospora sp. GCM10030261 TaxID=3273420 RepID=UPI003608807B